MKNFNNKRVSGIIILTTIIGIFLGISAIIIMGNMIMENTIETAPYVFDKIYGGLGGKVLDLTSNMAEYDWLLDVKNITDIATSVLMPFGILIIPIVLIIEDRWLPARRYRCYYNY